MTIFHLVHGHIPDFTQILLLFIRELHLTFRVHLGMLRHRLMHNHFKRKIVFDKTTQNTFDF